MSESVPCISPGEGYRLLTFGERVLPGDEAWTWQDPGCTKVGWLVLEKKGLGPNDKIDEGHVPVRRKIEGSF